MRRAPRAPRSALLLAITAVAAIACATELRPAPEATTAPGPGEGAVARDAGVEVEARVKAWRWAPLGLDSELTPVLVEIDNGSEHPLRLRYEDLSLVDGSGRSYAALPPFDIDTEVTMPVRHAYGLRGFHVASHLGPYYPDAAVYPFVRYGPYYESYYPSLSRIELPTAEMVIRALPEGVIDPDGGVAGFVYFEHVEDPAEGRVDFRFRLVDAETKQGFGEVGIPFRSGS